MKTKNMTKSYAQLTAEERFRLMLAAGGRGDQVEQERLRRAGKQIELCTADHAPYAYAFKEIALLHFLEVLDHALRYDDLLPFPLVWHAAVDGGQAEDNAQADNGVDGDRQRLGDLCCLAGFVLSVNMEGWKRFCSRFTIPPLQPWHQLPGYQRLQRALTHASQHPFSSDEILYCMNALQPAGRPKLTAVPLHLTSAGVAATLEELYRWRVQCWGG